LCPYLEFSLLLAQAFLKGADILWERKGER